MHLNSTLRANSDRKLILPSNRPQRLYWADFDELEKTIRAVYKLDHPIKGLKNGIDIVGSCNGLLCLKIALEFSMLLWNPTTRFSIVLWNPTTREYLQLPVPGLGFPSGKKVVYGFGYDDTNDDYKVFSMLEKVSDSDGEVNVFSVKSKSWRKILGFPYYPKHERDGVLAAGALHWVVRRNPGSAMELIAAFDLSTEEYRLVLGPHFSKNNRYLGTMGVLGESLCLVYNYSGASLFQKYADIWVMKDYAVEESWTKLFTFPEQESNFIIKPLRYVTPVAYSKSGKKLLMVQNGRQPLWYDLEKREVGGSRFCISRMPIILRHEMCFGSLVRLDGGTSGHVGSVVDRNQPINSQGTQEEGLLPVLGLQDGALICDG